MQAFQSRNVNQGHFVAAALTSFVIGIAQTISLKMVPDASEIGALLYILGGPVGVVTGMFVHSRTLGRRKETNDCDCSAADTAKRASAAAPAIVTESGQ